jgi:hypothetical protein
MGLNDQIGYGEEAAGAWGVAVPITRHYPLLTDDMDQEIGRIESEAVIAGARVRRSSQRRPGNKTVGGDVGHELYDRNMGLLFKHAWGKVTTVGTPDGAGGTKAPYTHTFEPGSLRGLGLTTEIGREATGGTVERFLYVGCKVVSWALACAEGEIATWGHTLVGKSEATGGALSVPAYVAAAQALTFNDGSLTIAGSEVATISSVELAGDNGLKTDRRFFSRGGLIDEPLEKTLRAYTGTFKSEFDTMVNYNRYVNADEVPFVLKFRLGTNEVRVEGNAQFDGETPKAGVRSLAAQTINFSTLGPTSDAGAMKLIVVNGDATP